HRRARMVLAVLKPLSPNPDYEAAFVVADIENRSDGSLIVVDVCWREAGEIIHEDFSTWEAFWKWIIRNARNDSRFRTIYAHNGGGWDWLSLSAYLLREGKDKRQSLTAITAG